MKEIFIIIKKELKNFFTNKRMLMSVIIPCLVLFILYTIIGKLGVSYSGKEISMDTTFKVGIVSDNDSLYNGYEQKTNNYIIAYNQALNTNYKTEYIKVGDIYNLESSVKNNEYIAGVIIKGTGDILVSFNNISIDFYIDSQNNVSNLYKEIVSSSIKAEIDKSINFSMITNDTNPVNIIAILARYIPLVIVIFLFSSVLNVSSESIAGEKERNTLSSLLVTPVSRFKLAIGKILSLSIIGLFTSCLMSLSILLPLVITKSVNISYLQIGIVQAILIVIIIIFASILFVSIVSLISAFSKTTKEALTYSTPILILIAISGALISQNSINTQNIFIYFIPIINIIKILSDIFVNTINVGNIIISIISTMAYIFMFSFLLAKVFNSEKIMFN